MNTYDELYGVGLLDDIHNFFPAILYQPQRFRTVQDLLLYISRQTQRQFNLFDRGLRQYEQTSQVTPRSTPVTIPSRQASPSTSTSNPATNPTDTFLQSLFNPIPQVTARTVQAAQPHLNITTETFDITPILTTLLTGGGGAAGGTTRPVGTATTLNSLNDFINLLRGDTILEPVPVVPTQTQIDTATHVFESLRSEHADSVCSICQDGYTENILVRQIRHCNHMFHRQCIDQWFRQNVHCPVCRFDIRDHTSTNSTNGSTINSYFS
jgi:hypothetical protein